MTETPATMRQLRSLVTPEGELRLSLSTVGPIGSEHYQQEGQSLLYMAMKRVFAGPNSRSFGQMQFGEPPHLRLGRSVLVFRPREVKLGLAKKYEHLSKIRKSKISQAKAIRRAAGYRHEAAVLSRA